MNNLSYWLARIYYNLTQQSITPIPTGFTDEYWAERIFRYAGGFPDRMAGGKPVQFWLESWYYIRTGQQYRLATGTLPAWFWLAKLYDQVLRGSAHNPNGQVGYNSAEFWAEKLAGMPGLGGEASAPVMAVTGNGVEIANGDATPSVTDDTDFGSTPYSTTVSKTYTINNTGNAALTGISVLVPTGYTLVTAPDATIAASGSDTFTVRCDAGSVAVLDGDITIESVELADYVFAITCTVSETFESFLISLGATIGYDMQETTGTNEPNFATPGTNDGTISNATLGQTGANSAANEAYDWGGTNSQVSIPAGAGLQAAIPATYIFVINPDQYVPPQTFASLLYKDGANDTWIRLRDVTTPETVSVLMKFVTTSLSITFNNVVPLDSWTILAVRLGEDKRLSLIGGATLTLQSSATQGVGNRSGTSSTVYLGYDPSANNFQYDGLFDAFAFLADFVWYGDIVTAAILKGLIAEYVGDSVRYSYDIVTQAINDPEGISIVDVNGDGLDDIVTVSSTAATIGPYWLRQNTDKSFTQYRIGSEGDTLEGVVAGDFDGDGAIEIVTLDQVGGIIRLYKHGGDPTTVPWSVGEILTGRYGLQDCRAWDIDGDGRPELVYTWEGAIAGEGGVHWLDWNSGSSLLAASWTDHTMIQHPGSWGIASRTADLAGNGRGDIVFSARDARNAAPTVGIYWLAAPADPTDPWTRSTIENRNEDWLHVDVGEFFGNGHGKDVCAVEYADAAIPPAIYDFSNAWARTDLPNPTAGGNFACQTIPQGAGRDWIATCFENEGAFINKYVGGAWTAYKIENWIFGTHPLDRKWQTMTYAGETVWAISDSGGDRIMVMRIP